MGASGLARRPLSRLNSEATMVTVHSSQVSFDPAGHKPTERVLDVLEVLSRSRGGCTLTDVSAQTGISKSTLSPILRTLKDRRFVSYEDATGAYSIGINSFSVGAAYEESDSIVAALRVEMEGVVAHCRETCQLGVLDGSNVFYLAKVDSPQAIRLISSTGRRVPAYCTALGKALLCEKTEEELHELIIEPLVPFTSKTLGSVDELAAAISEQRKTGIYRETEESLEGVTCMAVPLRRYGEIVAAVSVSAPRFRLGSEREGEIIEALHSYQASAALILESFPDCDDLLMR